MDLSGLFLPFVSVSHFSLSKRDRDREGGRVEGRMGGRGEEVEEEDEGKKME